MKTIRKILSMFMLAIFCIWNFSVLNLVHADETLYTITTRYYDSENKRTLGSNRIDKVASWANFTVNTTPDGFWDAFTCTAKPANFVVTWNIQITVDCKVKEEKKEEKEKLYTLTIHYLDSETKRRITNDYVNTFTWGSTYSVTSPTRKNKYGRDLYTISTPIVEWTINTGLEIDVRYTKIATEETTVEDENDKRPGAYDTPYDEPLYISTIDTSLSSAINWWDVVSAHWSDLFNEQVNVIIWYVIDFFIVIWIVVAFIGWYKIMTSEKEETMKEGIRLVIFGILWIIIMVSARFIANALVWTDWIITKEFANSDWNNPNWIQFADNLYNTVMYPFIKVALYFVIWILFFIMVGKVIGFVTATDDSAKKKAGWIIIWCVIGILIIMWSKQIVEAVMWNQDDVLKIVKAWSSEASPARIDEQWNPILEFGSIPLIAQIINWVMWLTMLAIVVLIIIQWYKIFTKPDDPKTRESLKKAILYIIIWVLVIGAAYVISNVLVVNNISINSVVAE